MHWLAWEEPLPFACLVGELVAGGRKQKIEITVLQASKTINNAPLLRKEGRSTASASEPSTWWGRADRLFLPQDIELIASSPASFSLSSRFVDPLF